MITVLRRGLWGLLVIGLALGVPGPTLADEHAASGAAFSATLTGDQETPPTGSSGVGSASFVLSEDGSRLDFTLSSSGTTSAPIAAHIHRGHPGEAGPIVVNLCGTSDTPACGSQGVIAQGTITAANLTGPLAGRQLGDLLHLIADEGAAYVNIHTSTFPAGETRGQLIPGAAASGEHQGGGEHGDTGGGGGEQPDNGGGEHSDGGSGEHH